MESLAGREFGYNEIRELEASTQALIESTTGKLVSPPRVLRINPSGTVLLDVWSLNDDPFEIEQIHALEAAKGVKGVDTRTKWLNITITVDPTELPETAIEHEELKLDLSMNLYPGELEKADGDKVIAALAKVQETKQMIADAERMVKSTLIERAFKMIATLIHGIKRTPAECDMERSWISDGKLHLQLKNPLNNEEAAAIERVFPGLINEKDRFREHLTIPLDFFRETKRVRGEVRAEIDTATS